MTPLVSPHRAAYGLDTATGTGTACVSLLPRPTDVSQEGD